MCNPSNQQQRRDPERVSDIGVDDIPGLCPFYQHDNGCDCEECLKRQGVF